MPTSLLGPMLLALLSGAPAQPCKPYVPPIRSSTISIVVRVNGSAGPYTDAVYENLVRAQLGALSLEARDDNTFVLADVAHGQAVNLYFTYTVRSDSNDSATGSLELAGWGQGLIANFSRNRWYENGLTLLTDLAEDAYSWIHTGWHDSRPACAPAE